MTEIILPDKIKIMLENFTRDIKAACSNNLISLILYGSAASGEFTDANSNLNVLIVLKDDSLTGLKAIKPVVTRFGYRRIQPIIFNKEYILSSLDVFPIEFLDMKENYHILWGEDTLKDVVIDTKNLRFQCEQELKLKLINLKQAFLRLNPADRTMVSNLLFRNFTSCLHILRNLVRLKGKKPAYIKEEILREITVELQLSITTFLKVLEAKKEPSALKTEEILGLLIDFTSELEKITKAVDRI